MVDYVLATSVALLVAATVVLGAFLARYAKLVREANKSTRMAKDLWESMNARFGVIDARLIDVMVKSEVMSSKVVNSHIKQEIRAPVASREEVQPSKETIGVPRIPVSYSQGTTDTEVRVLKMLSEGPRSSAQIKEALGRSREHTARLMKGLFERGLVVRNDRNKPYVYEITQAGKSYVVS